MNERRIDCEEALWRLAAYLDDELEDAEHGAVERHLEACRSCFSRAEFEKRLKAQLAGLRRGPVDSAFERRIRTLIGEFGSSPGPDLDAT